MDIYAAPGSKVRYTHPLAGYLPDQKQATKHLTVAAEYTVDRTVVGDFSTKVSLVEVPGEWFNSVMFESVT